MKARALKGRRYNYETKTGVKYSGERIIIPDEVMYSPGLYADERIEFPGYVCVSSGNIVKDKPVRVRLERHLDDPLHFIVRGRRDKASWAKQDAKKEVRYWEIRVHIKDRHATVHVTKCTEWGFRRVWKTWENKLISDGLATDLELAAHRVDEVIAWQDPGNADFRVSVRHTDETNLPPIYPLDDLRWSEAATKFWKEWYEYQKAERRDLESLKGNSPSSRE